MRAKPWTVPLRSAAACSLAAVLSSFAAVAQHPRRVLRDSAVALAAASPSLGELDGRLLAYADRYKASFAGGGMTLTPALGERAPESLPLRWRAASISRGGVEVWHRGAPLAAARVGDRRVERELCAGIRERFELRPEGVEVSYVFERPLSGEGDLVVRIAIGSVCGVPVRRADGTLSLARPGTGGVSIGSVTGIGADGSRAPGLLRAVSDEAVELVLPEEFVNGARWPLVLDPLIGTEGAVVGYDTARPDVAYDATNDVYLVVFEQRFSSGDVDVLGRRLRRNGQLLGGTFPISAGAGAQIRPRVASVAYRDRFLVVWQASDTPFGPFRVYGRAVDASNGSTASNRISMSNPSDDARNPDVGGNRSALHDECAVVWENYRTGRIEVAALRMPVSGSPILPATGALSSPGSSWLDGEPRISEGTGNSRAWCVAWSRYNVLAEHVFARRVDINATGIGSEVDLGGGRHPDVDGDGDRYVVAYDVYSGSSQRDVRCRPLRVSNGSLALAGSSGAVATSADDESAPAIGYVAGKFLIVWTGDSGGFVSSIYGRAYDPSCSECGLLFRLDGGTPAHDRDAAVASTWAAGENADEAMILAGEHEAGPPFRAQVWAQRYEAFHGGSITQVRPGCGSGTHAITQPLAIGNPDFEFVLSTQASAALFTAAFVPPTPLTCGSCRVMSRFDVSLAVTPFLGVARLPLPIPCLPMLAGHSIDFQWIEVGVPTSPCPIVPNLTASPWMRGTVDY